MKDNHISLLAQWHANPLTKDELEQLAQRIKQRLSQHQTSSQYFLTTLQQLIYNWWTEQPQISDLERAFVAARSKRQLALANLLIGQLLMSRKMTGANAYLRKGLHYADGLFKASDYFMLYNRHEELAILRLNDNEKHAYSLDELLKEAHVIYQLTKHTAGCSVSNTGPIVYSIP